MTKPFPAALAIVAACGACQHVRLSSPPESTRDRDDDEDVARSRGFDKQSTVNTTDVLVLDMRTNGASVGRRALRERCVGAAGRAERDTSAPVLEREIQHRR